MLLLEDIQAFDLIKDTRNGACLRVVQIHALDATQLHLDVSGSHGLVRHICWQRNDQAYLEKAPEQRLMRDPSAVLGCLLGGALGDACGAPVEFLTWSQIQHHFGSIGVQDLQPAYGTLGAVTDDTQMMLFTAEGLLRATVREKKQGLSHTPSIIHSAYMRWLTTQGEHNQHGLTSTNNDDGWLSADPRLQQRRAPGLTCLKALCEAQHLGDKANNNSKGCGGIMRVAPCAFAAQPFTLAVQAAQLTHGHPTGYLAAGLFADILARLWQSPSLSLLAAVEASLHEHGNTAGMQETERLLHAVLALHDYGIEPNAQTIEQYLGGGWIAEEALAIGLWCALSATDFTDGVCKAVNHGGDSDSTGLIAGHFLGLLLGPQALPRRWLKHLEMRDIIEQIASDLCSVPQQSQFMHDSKNTTLWQRYPGW